MVSRKSVIIATAEKNAAKLAERFKASSRARANTESLSQICKTFLLRKTPWLPTAALVAEAGATNNSSFPSERTIYNAYRQDLAVWRSAYREIVNFDLEPPLGIDDVARIDTSNMGHDAGNIVYHLKAIIIEQTQRINVLKHLTNIEMRASSEDQLQTEELEKIVQQIQIWLGEVSANPLFVFDELGMRIGRKTPIGAKIMDKAVFESIEKLIKELREKQNIRKMKKEIGW